MNNFEMYSLLKYIINKEQTGNMINTEEFEMLINKHSKLYQRELLSPFEEYSPNIALTKGGDSKTTSIINSLQPFMVEDYLITLTNGVGSMPSDYAYHMSTFYNYITNNTSCGTVVTPVNLELCSFSEFKNRKTQSLLAPDMTYPIFAMIQDEVTVAPSNITKINMSYVKKPTDAVIAVNIVNFEEVYDSASSTELEWNDTDKLILVGRVLKDVGVNLRAQDIYQYGNEITNKGK